MIKTVFDEIKDELAYQEQKWGLEADDTSNTPWHWVSYIVQYATKWMAGSWAPLEKDVVDGFRAMMVKVAALAVAAINSVDRQREANGTTHYEQQ